MKGGVGKRTPRSGTVDWYYTIYLGRDEKGKQRQLFKGGFKRKSDADETLRRKVKETEQLRGAQSFHDVLVATALTDPKIKNTAIAALESLRVAASACNQNPVADQMEDALSKAFPREESL